MLYGRIIKKKKATKIRKRYNQPSFNRIRIHHGCEGVIGVGIEQFVPRNTVWHHEACRVMTETDFLSHPHTNNGFFFLFTIDFLFKTKHPEDPEYAEMQYR